MQSVDPRNKNLYIYVNGEILKRSDAKISVFDSVVQGGDAVWEGLRVYKGKTFGLHEHLQRLQDSALAMAFNAIPTNEFIIDAIKQTLSANKMTDEVHMRMTLTRGEKITSGMDPRLNQAGCGLIVLAEWKPPIYDLNKRRTLITSSTRRNSPLCIDSKIHHNNLINNILAKIEANVAQADAALMLDIYGFVAEVNATNIFMIKNGILYTPFADACLPGITRSKVLEIAKRHNIPHQEKNLSLTEFYTADEVFTSGTMSELVPVSRIDGRNISPNPAFPLLMPVLYDHLQVLIQKEAIQII
ncbi:UNVERIFIED_CONTAM: hypothetical protein GTU68_035461 [Idotea baltica]|nr:hypothetical protein [Idotea baltica]